MGQKTSDIQVQQPSTTVGLQILFLSLWMLQQRRPSQAPLCQCLISTALDNQVQLWGQGNSDNHSYQRWQVHKHVLSKGFISHQVYVSSVKSRNSEWTQVHQNWTAGHWSVLLRLQNESKDPPAQSQQFFLGLLWVLSYKSNMIPQTTWAVLLTMCSS